MKQSQIKQELFSKEHELYYDQYNFVTLTLNSLNRILNNIANKKKEVPFVPVNRNGSGVELAEECPYCGKKHYHGNCGSNYFGSPNGFRRSHCHSGDYYIYEIFK